MTPPSPSKPAKPSSKPQPRLTSATAMAHNARVLDFLRSTFSAIVGSTAGILGLTGFQGFGFYIAASLFFSLLITLIKCRPGSPAKYFQSPAWELGVESMSASGLFSYVLFWTMISGVIRIYG
ncbi:hypothetical protein BCR44DRAFT_125417 [Catenaria anguillulae PL171]|uniref:ER membrane protein complex subunit 6 n=1 Tax=Catenaria anguillulae PL171 TaxID=765915 RepID=A0A1Y2HS60_9FUNG|nr:hypothetical protein BCR44DRAFT_125417 [Catenaria anguillulae PL171]